MKSSICTEIQNQLLELKDEQYRDFHAKLVPTIDKDSIIGVRVPMIRKLAKSYAKNPDIHFFLEDLPHQYFDENQFHMSYIENIKDYDSCVNEIERFLPYINNWAVCDGHNPKIFKKHLNELLEKIEIWIMSDRPYTVRFAINMLMDFYLDEAFDKKYLEMVASVKYSGEDKYYVDMEIAWYFATALAKQYESALPYIEKSVLEKWTHNKAIQKAVESYRITPEQKAYLKQYKIK